MAADDMHKKPLKLNLGSGAKRYEGFLNVDHWPDCHPDIVWDLEKTPWPFETNSTSHVLLSHCLEHLGQTNDAFIAIMREIYRICRDKATIEIVVPHPAHDNFATDPTHVRPILPQMFDLFNVSKNHQWIKEGFSFTPLALQHEVNFEVIRVEYKIDHLVQETSENFNQQSPMINLLLRNHGRNSIFEIFIHLTVHKDDPAITITPKHDPLSKQENLDALQIQKMDEIKYLLKIHAADQAFERAKIFVNDYPREPFGWNCLAFLALQSHQKKDALSFYQSAIENQAANAETYCNIGILLSSAQKYKDALPYFSKSLNENPHYAEAHNAMGVALKALSKFDQALKAFSDAIKLNQDYAEAYYNRGNLHFAMKDYSKADHNYLMAIKYKPDYAEAFNGRGNVMYISMNFDAAIYNYTVALQMNASLAEPLNNRAVLYTHIEEFDRAFADNDLLLSKHPHYGEGYFNRGNIYFAMKQFEKAFHYYHFAENLHFSQADIDYNRGFIDLLKGDLKKGFKRYEYRRQKKVPLGLRNINRPLWNGKDDLKGKTLYVYWEQGLGDTIQFIRFLPILTERGGTILFEAQKKLIPLLKTFQTQVIFCTSSPKEEDYDYHIPLMSLPAVLDIDINSLPQAKHYLTVQPDKYSDWQTRLGDEGFKIAVCWKCSHHLEALGRSFPISLLKPISEQPNIRLINVQQDLTHDEIEAMRSMRIENYNDQIHEENEAFLDTAAILSHCDLLISCDTSVAHVAGALGIPVWLVLKYVPHWTWMLDQDISPWYPSFRLFRQTRHGDWESAFEGIYHEIQRIGHDKLL